MDDQDVINELELGKSVIDKDTQFNSIVDMSRYRYVAHIREYPYHVN